LSQRLNDLDQLNEYFDSDADSSEGEDLLGDDTSGDGYISTDDQGSHNELTPPLTASSLGHSTQSLHFDERSNSIPERVDFDPQNESAVESSTLRSRNPRDSLFGPKTSSTATGISTATTDALLTHNRTEQETLTSSLLEMARQLKASSTAFANSLEDEKSILDQATEGLSKNELGLEAAQRRMGHLRMLTEGKGWWGRMLMYAYIAGLMVLALMIVFVLPKLRF
jgi:hypothetical protein